MNKKGICGVALPVSKIVNIVTFKTKQPATKTS